MKVLVANIGSTSFKYRLLDMENEAVLKEGKVERIGRAGGDCPGYPEAISRCLKDLIGPGKALARLEDLGAVGFKAIRAKGISGARRVDEEVLKAMEDYFFLFPAHNPPYVAAMRAFAQAAPSLPLTVLFETAFYDDVPEAVATYAVPYEWKEKYLVRRYGFHGASHAFASQQALKICPRPGLRHISCHLGGSSSLTAIRGGKAIDNSFGMTPQAGLPQNNRVGDLDVFAVLYMMKEKGLNVDQAAEILGSQSGLAGVSGVGEDVRDLQKAASEGNSRAKLALDMYVASTRRYLGAYMIELGGVDIITFSGGIGEKSAWVRAEVLKNLEEFGVKLDQEKNEKASGQGRISAKDSKVEVWVVGTNEEVIVARAAVEVVKAGNQK